MQRSPAQPEDCLVVADPAAKPLPLAAARLTPQDGSWLIDSAVSVDKTRHGACVLSRADGGLVGMILIDKQATRVALASNPNDAQSPP